MINESQYERYLDFIVLNMKIYLLSSLSDEAILHLLSLESFSEIKIKSDFIKHISDLDIETILNIS